MLALALSKAILFELHLFDHVPRATDLMYLDVFLNSAQRNFESYILRKKDRTSYDQNSFPGRKLFNKFTFDLASPI